MKGPSYPQTVDPRLETVLRGLNHITVAVSDLNRSFEFYVRLLGMRPHAKWARGAYLTLGGLWFCLSCDDSQPGNDYTHIAFDVASGDFPKVKHKLLQAGVMQWKDNKSEGDSLYILDPDGHKLEVHAGDLQSRLDSLKARPCTGLEFF